MSEADDSFATEGIAIIGMAGRFPKARDLEAFWENIRDGVPALSTFSDEELRAAGVPPELLANPRYVKARGRLEDTALFDAAFFDYSAREAELTDPQHRLLLECAWEALEDAGYDSQRYGGRIGVFAGASMSTYMLEALRGNGMPDNLLQLAIGSLSDFLATRISYKLNLRGPSVGVQTACSTSLVATHMACLHLLAGQCDLALAGGVSLRAQEVAGCLYQEGGIFSPDGKCRAFDARAQGTVDGSGLGLVVLKRLEDALEDGDDIRAVIRATVINNDGSLKVGFTAPSVQGQAEAIALAHELAGVSADTLGYVEAHGTGTPLGDPIEIAALSEAFARTTEATGFCAMGSVKTNIGHLDAAAGVAGLLKTVLMLQHKQLPPSLNYERPNPRIDFARAPVYVNSRLADWPERGFPRRAGVSSFGIGGTNAHVVLEEAAPSEPSSPGRGAQVLVLSARTPTALARAADRLARHLEKHPEQPLADVAFTLQLGRRAFAHRRAVVCRTREEALGALAGHAPERVLEGEWKAEQGVAFMFSGQGAQYVDMGRELYASEPVFREQLDHCARLLKPHLDVELLQVLYPSESQREPAAARLARTGLTQPALFAIEYALARQWEAWGVRPRAMLGHSVGEYVAACLAGVFSLEDALAVIATRGQLMQRLPPGAMLSVPLPEAQLRELLGERLSLAAINGPALSVAAGPEEDIQHLERLLTGRGVSSTRLHTSHAFHSAMVEPALAPFAARLATVTLRPPKIPFVSNVTGDWITPAEATSRDYWVRHLRHEVRFSDGVKRLLQARDTVLLEVGPGRTLSTLALRHPERPEGRAVLSSLRHPQDRDTSDVAFALRTLGALWLSGVPVDWKGLHKGHRRRRVPLPTYPFERQPYWLEGALPRPAPTHAASEAPPARTPPVKHGRPSLQTPHVAPATEVERRLVAIWEECLGFSPIGTHDGFFDLGGHSLLATQILSRLRDEFGVVLTVKQLFEEPTVAGLAAKLGTPRPTKEDAAPRLERALRDAPLPLSFAQQRLWMLEQLTPGGSAYHLPQALRLRGPLDAAALEASFTGLVRRHESLRTSFPSADGQPHQEISPPTPWVLRRVELDTLPGAEREAAALRLLAEDVERPFELERGPLLRATLIRLAPEEHVLGVTLHHLIADGWSLRVLTREMVEIYLASRRGEPPALAEPTLQYVDYALWQRRWLQGPALDAQLGYWKERLAGLQPLELPTDRPRPPTPSFRAARSPFTLTRPQSDALEALGQREGVTPFMVLLAAFSAALGRFSGRSDIAVGSPIAGRGRTELEGMIGMFVNTLVLRADLSGDPTGRALLGRVKEATLGAYAHQDLPFEKLVEELHPERDPSRSPLFQVMLSLQEESSLPASLEGLSVQPMELETGSTQFDLTLWLRPTPQGYAGALEYSAELFDAATVARLAREVERTLESLAEQPERRLSELARPSPRELSETWGEGTLVPPVLTVHEAIEQQAARAPERPAIIWEGAVLTHGELDREANRLARLLRRMGAGPESRIGLCVERSAEAVVAMLGILKAGAAYVPLDPSAPPERLVSLLEDVAAPLVLTRQSFAAHVSGGRARVLCLDALGESLEREEDGPVGVKVSPESAAYVLHTSGSTGRPKGVVVPHRALANHLRAVVTRYGLTPEDRVLQFSALSFDVAAEELFPTLASGATVVPRRTGGVDSVAELRDFIDRHGVTVVNLPAPYWHEWVDELPRLSAPVPRSVRLVVTGSQAPSPERLERWRERVGDGVRWLNAYGPTEATITSTIYELPQGPAFERPRVPVGRPLPGVRAYVLDEHLELVPAGAPGELYLGGFGVARGYLDQPALTAAVFVPDPFSGQPGARMYRTGDLARLLPDGHLEFLGRRDHQVKLRGFRIELGEIESVLEQLPEVREAVVLHRREGPGEGRLEAHVVAAGPVPSEAELRTRLGARLPHYLVPARVVFHESLPRLASDKVDRKALALRAPALEARDAERDFVAPRDATEERLARLWAEVLKLERVSIHDGFFERGGDSLMAIRLIARANQAGLPLTARQLFQHQTIAELAAVVGTRAQEPEAAPSAGPVPLTPAQRRFLEQELPAPHHWNRSLLLEIHEPLQDTRLREALRLLMLRHDALRLRFHRDETGWRQLDAGDPGDDVPYSRIELSGVPDAQLAAALRTATEALQQLDLSRGPLVRVAHLDLGSGRPGRLFIVLHFLVADGLSWGLFVDELQAAYAQLLRGEAVQLPPRTSSFRTWAEHLAGLARSEETQRESEYWLTELGGTVGRVPLDHPGGANTEGSMRSVQVELTAAETQRLLRDTPAALGRGVETVLLAPLAGVLSHWMDGAAVLLDLGRHGREARDESVDLSRTLGCMTTDCPVRLDVRRARDTRELLGEVGATLARIPGRGLGYGLLRFLGEGEQARGLQALPRAEISFDYLSQRLMAETASFSLARESAGADRDPSARRSHVLQILASVVEGRLRLEWRYSENLHERATVERLAAAHLRGLRELLAG